MITSQLERLILKGLAQYRVINHAFGTFGKIPIPSDSIAIITNVSWFPFLNPIKAIVPATPATGTVTLVQPLAPFTIFNASLNIGGVFIGSVSWDKTTPANTTTSIQNALNTNLPGWTVALTATVPNPTWTITTVPLGTPYNGQAITVTGVIPAGSSFTFTPFAGGANGPGVTYKEFFAYIEYQLKVDGKKTINKLIYRNGVDFQWFNSYPNNTTKANTPVGTSGGGTAPLPQLTDPVDNNTLMNNFLILTQRPIIYDTYFVCEEFIKLTITRNSQVDTLTNTMGLVNSKADEINNPNGIANSSVLLKSLMKDYLLNAQDYIPGSYEATGQAITQRGKEAYNQDIWPSSLLTQPQGVTNTVPTLPNISPYKTHPLITLGIVFINKSDFDKLQNT